jgi:hypothetical protein
VTYNVPNINFSDSLEGLHLRQKPISKSAVVGIDRLVKKRSWESVDVDVSEPLNLEHRMKSFVETI